MLFSLVAIWLLPLGTRQLQVGSFLFTAALTVGLAAAWMPLGQTPVPLDVQTSIARQLGGGKESLQGSPAEVRQGLCDLAAERCICLIKRTKHIIEVFVW